MCGPGCAKGGNEFVPSSANCGREHPYECVYRVGQQRERFWQNCLHLTSKPIAIGGSFCHLLRDDNCRSAHPGSTGREQDVQQGMLASQPIAQHAGNVPIRVQTGAAREHATARSHTCGPCGVGVAAHCDHSGASSVQEIHARVHVGASWVGTFALA